MLATMLTTTVTIFSRSPPTAQSTCNIKLYISIVKASEKKHWCQETEAILASIQTDYVNSSKPQVSTHLQISFGVRLFAYIILPGDEDVFMDLFS